MNGRDFKQCDMADILGISQMALVHWRKDGCPCRRAGNTWLYNSFETIEWLRARDRKSSEAPEASEERARLLRAQAELKELELARQHGEIVEISEVEKQWAEMVMRFKDRLVQLPPRGAELSGLLPAAAEKKLKSLVNEALMELADGKSKHARAERKKNKPAARATA